jgi:hypothetical protein
MINCPKDWTACTIQLWCLSSGTKRKLIKIIKLQQEPSVRLDTTQILRHLSWLQGFGVYTEALVTGTLLSAKRAKWCEPGLVGPGAEEAMWRLRQGKRGRATPCGCWPWQADVHKLREGVAELAKMYGTSTVDMQHALCKWVQT